MAVVLRRAALVAFAAVLVCAATTQFAEAQSSDYDNAGYDNTDYGNTGYDGDDTDDYVANLFKQAMPQALPPDAGAGMPTQPLDLALTQSPQLANTSSDMPGRIVAINDHFDVHADGSSTTTSHTEAQVLTAQAINVLAQQSVSYSDSMEDLQIKNAYTLKPDGTRLPVTPEAILTRQKSMPDAYFTDLKEKVILFPNVEPGDTLVYDSIIQSRAQIPGQFYVAFAIPRIVEIDNETISFTTPKNFPLAFDSYGLPVQKTTDGDSNLYTVHYSNRTPVLETPQFLSDLDHGLRLFASSTTSYEAFVAGYTPLVSAKSTVTPKILAEANTITAGVSDRREQARKLYEWVSSHIRYVAVLFGDGGLVPHDADSTLTNAYGDCKDHAVLYSTLLKAKGIPSDLVIINGSNGYILPQIPQITTFNHVIVWLPEFGLYADTTSNSTPFGSLPQFEYGKSVVHLGGTGAALRHTPLLTESSSAYSSVTNLKLDSDGKLTGRHYATASGALAGVLRGVANEVGASGLDAVAGNILRARGMGMATGSISFPQTFDLSPQYSYSSNYQFNRTIPSGNIAFAPPEGLNLVDAYSSAVLGPVADPKLATADALPCFGGNLTDDYAIEFPADRRLASMPQDGHVQTAYVDYRSHWSLVGNVVSVHRELRTHFDKALCTGDTLRETRDAIVRIRNDYAGKIFLAAVHAS